jgi:hypothetical protein
MASSTNNLIKVKDTTKVRLDLFKNSKTYDTVISEMLLYFETTGITPQSNVMPPNIAAKEQASRVIEVVRGIEKSTNVRLKNIEQLLLSLVGEVKTPGDNPDEYMHISQVQELLDRSKQLEQEARENREKAGKLQTDLEIARQEKGTPAVGCNTHKILEIVERIDEVKKIPTFNDTVYEIDRNTLDMWVKRLKDELKK